MAVNLACDESKAMDYFPYNDPDHYFLTSNSADGLNELEVRVKPNEAPSITENEWEGAPGDIFQGNTQNRLFNNSSNPSSNSYSVEVTRLMYPPY